MTNEELATLNQKHERMKIAFEVVVNPLDWKAPISTHAKLSTWETVCRHFGVTHEEIVESIAYFTATAATVTVDGDTIRITAAGYRMGPAGDH